jgi:hypothetical protein
MAVGIAPEVRRESAAGPEGGAGGTNLYRLTVGQFLAMIRAGVFREGERVELLGGLLVEKMVKHPPHNFGVTRIAEALRAILPAGWIVWEEKSVALDTRSRPEPDIAVVRGPIVNFRDRDPKSKEIALIVEVAESSYSEDSGRKWALYAAAKIPVHAILNIPVRRLELYSKPWGRGHSARYRQADIFDASSEFPVLLEGRELGRVAVKDVLA